MQKFLISRGKKLSLAKPLVMGVLNVTPDSFSDGGKYLDPKKAVKRALEMIEEGADIIDIGGESSGPDSKDVSLKEELARVIPVVRMLRAQTEAWVSVDTYKAEVARSAIEAGADMINDVTAFRGDKGLAHVVAESGVPVVIMYSKDSSARTTRKSLEYKNVVSFVQKFLKERVAVGMKAGVKKSQFILDPGMGAFVSSEPKYSLQILKKLEKFGEMGMPILVGASRKGFIGQVLGVGLNERLEGGLAAHALAVLHGAAIIRTHDVKETRRVVDMVSAVMKS
jgi:dihydropteroate synthase